MNILVTGVTGFIGTHLLRVLKDQYEVHAFIRSSTDVAKVPADFIFVFNDILLFIVSRSEEHKSELQ